jgi:hypothetical protein
MLQWRMISVYQYEYDFFVVSWCAQLSYLYYKWRKGMGARGKC